MEKLVRYIEMFKIGDKVRLKEEVTLTGGKESITLWESNIWPSKATLICISDEKDGYVDVGAPGISGAHLLAERLRLETPDDFD